MEQKLISKECVPDNEVWVSPKTWEAPFGLKVNESQNKADNSDYIKCQCKVQHYQSDLLGLNLLVFYVQGAMGTSYNRDTL